MNKTSKQPSHFDHLQRSSYHHHHQNHHIYQLEDRKVMQLQRHLSKRQGTREPLSLLMVSLQFQLSSPISPSPPSSSSQSFPPKCNAMHIINLFHYNFEYLCFLYVHFYLPFLLFILASSYGFCCMQQPYSSNWMSDRPVGRAMSNQLHGI